MSTKQVSEARALRAVRSLGVSLGIVVTKDRDDHMRLLAPVMAAGLIVALGFALFGLPDIPLPMPTWSFGVVTPTCGLTRASTALARGQLDLALLFNPAAFVLAAGVTAAIVRWVVGKTSKTWINVSFKPTPIGWSVLVAIAILWWANQQLHAGLIMSGSI
ncbi:MAG: DUF2752 domain-containing protein [Actinobacteria bacterium]|nr:DUF2752 domain-containing protein [Actinomycetota bacterium]